MTRNFNWLGIWSMRWICSYVRNSTRVVFMYCSIDWLCRSAETMTAIHTYTTLSLAQRVPRNCHSTFYGPSMISGYRSIDHAWWSIEVHVRTYRSRRELSGATATVLEFYERSTRELCTNVKIIKQRANSSYGMRITDHLLCCTALYCLFTPLSQIPVEKKSFSQYHPVEILPVSSRFTPQIKQQPSHPS